MLTSAHTSGTEALHHGRQAPAHEDIVITGIGVVLPNTFDVDTFWSNISGGNPQVRALTRFAPALEGLPVRAAAEIDGFDHRAFLSTLPEPHAARYSREILIAMSAVEAARRDAGIDLAAMDPSRASLIQSSSRGAQEWWHASGGDRYGDSGAMLRSTASSPAALAAMYLGIGGLVTTLSSACVGGHHAVGLALQELRQGARDVVFAGGHDFPLTPEITRCFAALGEGVLSPDLEQPVRPYSADRNGMVLGEGAIVLCLERASHARARGARAYASVLAHGALNEGAHPMRMDLTGRSTATLVAKVLHGLARSPEEVGYFCGHGTATRACDLAECQALRLLYPDRPAHALPPIGSNKPIYGHTLGAAGVINIAATALMLHHQKLAPTVGVTALDPDCDQDHVTGGARPADLDLAVSLAFAIGSQSSVVVLGKAA